MGANLVACSFAMTLLAAVYTGMYFVSATSGSGLASVRPENLLSQLAIRVLGSSAGLVVCLAVIFACLTTAIALAVVFSEFVVYASKERISYPKALIASLALSFVVANLEFSGIQAFLEPILVVILPGLIVLSIFNYAHKKRRTEIVKAPVFMAFAASLIIYLLSSHLG